MIRSAFPWRGIGALLLGILLFSTIEVAAKMMQLSGGVAGHYPFWIGVFRFVITGLILIVPSLKAIRSQGQTLAVRDWAELAGLGVVGITLMSSFFHLAILHLPANVAALVFSCNPVFVVIFAPLVLPEKITFRKVAAAILCLTGVGLLAYGRAEGVSPVGLLLMFGALVAFAVYTVWVKKLTPRYGALPITGITGLLGGLFLLPVALRVEGFPVAAYGAVDWAGIFYLALAGTTLGYFFFIYGMGHVEAGIGSMSFFLKPFLAALFAWLILREPFTVPMMIGGAFILAGMATVLIRRRS